MGVTDKFAEFIVKTNFKDIPKETIAIAKEHILDTIGTTLAGSAEPPGVIMREFLKEIGGTPESGVVGAGFRSSAPNAALANGTMAHVLDYDDVLPGGHISVVVLPAVLTLGDKLSLSGKDVLLAYIVGFEVFSRLFGASHYVQYGKLHATALFGHMGATAACAKELALNAEQIKMAFGIAASEVSGVAVNSGTMVKSFHAGNACKNGVIAAMLAKKGYRSADNIIEDKVGFLNVFVGQGNYDLGKMTRALGNPFMIYSPGISIKRYPCCYWNCQPLDAIFGLIHEHNITYEQVESIEVEGAPDLPKSLRYSDPKDGLQAKFSINFNLAVALLDRKIVRDTFRDTKVLNPRTQEAMKKVKVTVHPDWPESEGLRHTPVTIRLKGGRVYQRVADIPRGNPANRLSWQELVDKFMDNASVMLSTRQANRVVKLVKNLEDVADISQLMAILTKKPALARV